MKKTLKHMLMMFLILAGSGASLYSQEKTLLEKFYTSLAASCATLDYSYSTEVSGVRIDGKGQLQIQDSMWHNVGDGLEIWCDGKTVWTADHNSEEVVIESVSEEESDQLANPALMFVHLGELFKVTNEVDSKDGKARIYVLKPNNESVPVEFFNVEFLKSDGSLRSGSFALEDGNSVRISVASVKMEKKKPVTYYRPEIAFKDSWIITDLR